MFDSDMNDTRLTKREEVKIVKQETIGFSVQSNNINEAAVEKVSQYLPELDTKTNAFGSNNSQTTMTMMSLTMLGGQSIYRMLRQILAEVEKRKIALSDSQVSHAKLVRDIEKLENQTDDRIQAAKYRKACVSLVTLEKKINGSFKDIATLIDAYNNIKETNNIPDEWDEVSFENDEKKHHVRRCFEMMYRNLLDGGRVQTSTIEYMQQFGVHPQICQKEVAGYIAYTEDRIVKGEILHSNDLEDFLDEMGIKYWEGADKTSERLFGKKNFANKDFMYKTVTK
tara:strand:+ start:1927 stop:2775 length:849 start_codon:yes stop_codon:yes gene_type:complete